MIFVRLTKPSTVPVLAIYDVPRESVRPTTYVQSLTTIGLTPNARLRNPFRTQPRICPSP